MSLEPGERSLAQDCELIDALARKSDDLLSKLAGVTPSLEQLTNETAKINLLFRNVVGDLNALSEKRFIENRVEVVHEKKAPPEPKCHEPRPATDEELREAVRVGLQSFGLLPAGELTDAETGYECFQRERPFSLVIGTPRWLEEDPLGATEQPQPGGALEESLLSEAIDDIVSPVSSTYEIEQATDADEWFRRNDYVSSPGGGFADDSSSISSASDLTQRHSVPIILPQPGGSKPPGGLFDDDSADDDDLFGITSKPTTTSTESKQKKAPITEKVATPLERPESSTPATAAPSFLDELKSKTKSKVQPSSHEDKTLPSTGKPPTNIPVSGNGPQTVDRKTVRDQIIPDRQSAPTKPPTTKAASNSRSLFDSDSDDDLLTPVAPLPKSLTRQDPQPKTKPQTKVPIFDSDQGSEQDISPPLLDPSTPTLSKSDKTVGIPKPIGLPKSSALFDSDSDSSDIFSRKPPKSTPKAAPIAAEPPVPKRPIGVSVLPPLSNPRADEDSDSDKDIFGPRPIAVRPPLQQSRLAPLSAPSTNTKTSTTSAAELQSRDHIPKPLESLVRPPSSESDDSPVENVPVKVQSQQIEQKRIPAKKPSLFESDSDDDSLFGASISKGPTKVTSTEKDSNRSFDSTKTPVQGVSSGSAEPRESVRITGETVTQSDIKKNNEDGADSGSVSGAHVSVKKIGIGLPVGLLQGLKQKQQQLGIAPADRQTPERAVEREDTSEVSEIASGSDEPPATPSIAEDNASVNVEPIYVSDAATNSLLINETVVPITEPAEARISEKLDPIVFPIPVNKEPPAEALVQHQLDDRTETSARAVEEASASEETKDQPEGDMEPVESVTAASKPTMDEGGPEKSTAASGSVKKIGLGLPAGLLQGLKLKQQELGLAPPQRKTGDSDSDKDNRTRTASTVSASANEQAEQPCEKAEPTDIINITKGRARGPTGRRLPTRTRTQPLQINNGQPTAAVETVVASPDNKSPTVTTDAHDRVTSASEQPTSTRQPDAANKDTPLKETDTSTANTKHESKSNNNENTMSVSEQHQEPVVMAGSATKPAGNDEKTVSEAKLFSSDSDDDLFTPKTSRAKESIEAEKKATSSVTKPVTKDPLSLLLAGDNVDDNDEKLVVTESVATSPANPVNIDDKKPPKSGTVVAPKKPLGKDLFEDSDNDEELFGTKSDSKTVTPSMSKSSTSSSLAQESVKTKVTAQSQQTKKGPSLFSSDSDSDDLFKK